MRRVRGNPNRLGSLDLRGRRSQFAASDHELLAVLANTS